PAPRVERVPLCLSAALARADHHARRGARPFHRRGRFALGAPDGDRPGLCAAAGSDLLRVPALHGFGADHRRGESLMAAVAVRDNMGFSLRLRKESRARIDEGVAKAARILNLEALLHRYPRELSGGQRQRVAMGRASVRDPKVFLFDEPLSNLDAKLRVAMRSEIKALHQRLKTTTVYVTHDQVEAMTMADRIAVMNEGRI